MKSAVFDGHNDVLTARMRGGIFAIFSPSPGDTMTQVHTRRGGVVEVPYADPLPQRDAAAHAKNLTDAQLGAIGGSGGLAGIVVAVAFLRPDFAEDADTPLELIVRHARLVRDRIGPEHVALGSDPDGAMIPTALGDVAGLPRLFDALRAGGFTPGEIDALAWGNWRRVLAAWWRD